MTIKELAECQKMLSKGVISQFCIYVNGCWHLGIKVPKYALSNVDQPGGE